MLWHAQEVEAAVRTQLRAGHAGVATRHDGNRARQLAGKQRARLHAKDAVRAALRIRIPAMDDDLRASVGRDGLGAHRRRGSFEEPQAFDKGAQGCGGRKLPVNDAHGVRGDAVVLTLAPVRHRPNEPRHCGPA